MTHLLDSLKINQERPECYVALGKIAMAVGTKIKPYVKNVLSMVNTGLTGAGAGKCHVRRAAGPQLTLVPA